MSSPRLDMIRLLKKKASSTSIVCQTKMADDDVRQYVLDMASLVTSTGDKRRSGGNVLTKYTEAIGN